MDPSPPPPPPPPPAGAGRERRAGTPTDLLAQSELMARVLDTLLGREPGSAPCRAPTDEDVALAARRLGLGAWDKPIDNARSIACEFLRRIRAREYRSGRKRDTAAAFIDHYTSCKRARRAADEAEAAKDTAEAAKDTAEAAKDTAEDRPEKAVPSHTPSPPSPSLVREHAPPASAGDRPSGSPAPAASPAGDWEPVKGAEVFRSAGRRAYRKVGAMATMEGMVYRHAPPEARRFLPEALYAGANCLEVPDLEQDGYSQASELLSRPGTTNDKASSIALAVVDALKRLHAAGLVHGDAHTGNVFLRQGAYPGLWDVRFIDLGMSLLDAGAGRWINATGARRNLYRSASGKTYDPPPGPDGFIAQSEVVEGDFAWLRAFDLAYATLYIMGNRKHAADLFSAATGLDLCYDKKPSPGSGSVKRIRELAIKTADDCFRRRGAPPS